MAAIITTIFKRGNQRGVEAAPSNLKSKYTNILDTPAEKSKHNTRSEVKINKKLSVSISRFYTKIGTKKVA